MAICNSCRNIRLGESGEGNTIIQALGAVNDVAMKLPAAALVMMEGLVPQAKKAGACQSCLDDLQWLKNELERHS